MFISKEDYDEIKINPYELCPCDSGKKFKFCCRQKAIEGLRQEEKSISFTSSRLNHMASTAWKEADFDICLGFDKEECEGIIKNAHTIQNKKIMDKIQEHGHVLYIKGEYDDRLEYKPVFKKISRNKASTFRGFCDFHDSKLFEKIEQEDYVNSDEQNFLFAFRSLTLQLHDKLRYLEHIKNNFKKYPAGMIDPWMVNSYRIAQLDVADYEEDYNLFKHDYLNKSFNSLRTLHFTLDYEVHFTTSAGFAVQYDLKQNILNDVYSDKNTEKMPSVYINIYPINGRTNIIMSYRSQDNTYDEYFNQLELIPRHVLIKYLNYLVIQYTENVFFKPSLIEKMEDTEKGNLLKSFSSSINLMDKLELLEENNYFKFNIFKKAP